MTIDLDQIKEDIAANYVHSVFDHAKVLVAEVQRLRGFETQASADAMTYAPWERFRLRVSGEPGAYVYTCPICGAVGGNPDALQCHQPKSPSRAWTMAAELDAKRIAELEAEVATLKQSLQATANPNDGPLMRLDQHMAERDAWKAREAKLFQQLRETEPRITYDGAELGFSWELDENSREAFEAYKAAIRAYIAALRADDLAAWLLHIDRVLSGAREAGVLDSWLLHELDARLKRYGERHGQPAEDAYRAAKWDLSGCPKGAASEASERLEAERAQVGRELTAALERIGELDDQVAKLTDERDEGHEASRQLGQQLIQANAENGALRAQLQSTADQREYLWHKGQEAAGDIARLRDALRALSQQAAAGRSAA